VVERLAITRLEQVRAESVQAAPPQGNVPPPEHRCDASASAEASLANPAASAISFCEPVADCFSACALAAEQMARKLLL
jgi:hypothetical protein